MDLEAYIQNRSNETKTSLIRNRKADDTETGMDLLSFHSEENMQEKVIADLQSFHNDADTVRERLLQLYIQIYPSLFASKAQPDPIFLIDEYLQGEFKELFSIDWSDENIETLVYMTTNCVSIEGFAGMMLYYCPKRYGKHYDAVVNKLLESDNGNGLANEKIEGLLGDYVNASSGATKKFYNLPYIWVNHFLPFPFHLSPCNDFLTTFSICLDS